MDDDHPRVCPLGSHCPPGDVAICTFPCVAEDEDIGGEPPAPAQVDPAHRIPLDDDRETIPVGEARHRDRDEGGFCPGTVWRGLYADKVRHRYVRHSANPSTA